MNLADRVGRALVVAGCASLIALALGAARGASADDSEAPATTMATPENTADAVATPTTTLAPSVVAPATQPESVDVAPQLAALVVSKPSAPRYPAATPANASVKLTWLAPSSNGGATVDRYAVQRSTSATGPGRTSPSRPRRPPPPPPPD